MSPSQTSVLLVKIWSLVDWNFVMECRENVQGQLIFFSRAPNSFVNVVDCYMAKIVPQHAIMQISCSFSAILWLFTDLFSSCSLFSRYLFAADALCDEPVFFVWSLCPCFFPLFIRLSVGFFFEFRDTFLLPAVQFIQEPFFPF